VPALRRIEGLDAGDRHGRRAVPFKMAARSKADLVANCEDEECLSSVPMESLRSTQPTVHADLVMGYVDVEPDDVAELKDGYGAIGKSKVPVVTDLGDGSYAVLDGHHRAVAAWARRRKSLQAIVRKQKPVNLADWNEDDHARDDVGRFTAGSGGSSRSGEDSGTKASGLRERPTPIRTRSIGHAVDLILEGKVVELQDVRHVHTVISRLAAIAKDAKAKGKDAPKYDLCQVTVANTNLFCGSKLRTKEFPNGVPRLQMPQTKSRPVPGSPADKLTKDIKGFVDAAPQLIAHLESRGIKVERGTVPAAQLKASQSELVGADVAGMMTSTTYDPGKHPIFISRDNYVIDGHHRWAAIVGRDAEDGKLGDLSMKTLRIDAPISEVLHIAREWSKKFGLSGRDMTARKNLSYRERMTMLLDASWDPDLHPRAEDGKFTSGSGGGSGSPVPKVAVDAVKAAAALSKLHSGHQDEAIKEAGEEFSRALGRIHELAPEADKELVGVLNQVMVDLETAHGVKPFTPGESIVDDPAPIAAGMGPIKGDYRMIEKALMDYGGDISKVNDAVRGTVVVESMDDVKRVVDSIKKHATVTREKDRISNPVMGYRDFMMNVKFSNGLNGEVQVHLKPLLRAKEKGGGHKIYEEMRSLIGRTDAESIKKVAQLTMQTLALYSAAFMAVKH
jgi:hypothetical protein